MHVLLGNFLRYYLQIERKTDKSTVDTKYC